MELITLYIGIGLIFSLIFDHLSKRVTPQIKPFGNTEKMVMVFTWPLVIIVFLFFLIKELIKLRK